MSVSIRRLIAVGLVLGWVSPSLFAIGIGIHVATDHHSHHHELEHEGHHAELTELMAVASHGHHHAVGSAPEHHHAARCDGWAPSCRESLSVAEELGEQAISTPLRIEVPKLDRTWRRGPPAVLFTVNCSLLL